MVLFFTAAFIPLKLICEQLCPHAPRVQFKTLYKSADTVKSLVGKASVPFVMNLKIRPMQGIY